jgi:hypothetical protein
MDPFGLGAVLLGGGLGLALRQVGRWRRRRRALLALARTIDGAAEVRGLTVYFTTKGGVPMTARLRQADRPPEVTEYRLATRAPVVGLLARRPADAPSAPPRRHELRFADAAFDERFIVRAAPRDVADALFDAGMRARILEVDPLGVKLGATGLTLELHGAVADPDRSRKAIDLLVWIRGELTRAVDEVDRQVSDRVGRGAPFREIADGEEWRQAMAERQAEIEELLRDPEGV